MTAQPVEAVWFWKYPKTAFRALYGRFAGSTIYSKDYLQVSGDCMDAMDTAFARSIGEVVPITYQWPGGTVSGELRDTSATETPRDHLSWPTTGPRPAPWTLTPTPDPLRAIPGDPDAKNETDAEAVLNDLESKDLGAWIVAVKLAGEPAVLHVRAYLDNPPTGFDYAATALLPEPIRTAMAAVRGACGVVVGGRAKPVRAGKVVDRVLSALERSPNVLLVGPPGTGKTVALEDLRQLYESGGTTLLFDPDKTFDSWPTVLPGDRKVLSVVFHPSYSYEEFVIGLVPKAGASFALEARPGPLLALAHWAQDTGRAALLVIDEFNRGNAAGIFGDTLALLDKDKRDDPPAQIGASIARAYPLEAVDVHPSYANSKGTTVETNLRLPASLRIVAALNSSDRSVAPLDAALRRRFAILTVEPDYDVLADHFGVPAISDPFVLPTDWATWTAERALQLTVAVLRGLNRRLSSVIGDDFLLGHAAFWSVNGTTTPQVVNSLAQSFDEQVAGTLRLTFADQDDQLAAVLGIGGAPVVAGSGATLASWEAPAAAVAAVAERRLKITSLSTLSLADAAKLLLGLT